MGMIVLQITALKLPRGQASSKAASGRMRTKKASQFNVLEGSDAQAT
jgi:hypothetical protein